MVSASKLFQTHSMYLTGVKLKRRGGAWFQHQSYFRLIPRNVLDWCNIEEERRGMISASKLFQTHSLYLTGVKLKRRGGA